jgi:branched-chain amino acid transport system substrate-binding protein
MRTTRRRLLLGAGFATMGTSAPPAPADSIAIGALYPFSGRFALLGDESFRGLDLATDERNAGGGLLGKPVRLVRGDAVDAAQASAEAHRLIAGEHVAALFGTAATSLSLAATQVGELADVPYFELGATGDQITGRGFKYLFRSCPLASAIAALSVEAIGTVLAKLWNTTPSRLKIAILYEDGPGGSTIAGFQDQACRDKGIIPAVSLSYAADAIDLPSVVQRLRGAAADVVLHTGVFNDILLFYRGMKQVGWKPRMIIGTGAGYSLNDMMQTLGADFEGTMDVDVTQYRVNEAAAPGVAAVAAAYQKKFGAPPRSGYSLTNYVGAKLFYDAIARAGSTDKDKIRAAVLATDIPVGGTAAAWGAKFTDNGQNVRARPMLQQWQKGSLVTLAPPDAAVAQPVAKLG